MKQLNSILPSVILSSPILRGRIEGFILKSSLFILSFFILHSVSAQFNIIPQPVEINYSKAQNVILDSTFEIEYYSHDLDDEAILLQEYFLKFHSLNLKIFFAERNNPDEDDGFEEVSGNNRIILEHLSGDIADTIGFYKLNILPGTVQIIGKEQGIFYGIQTFMQMTFNNLNLQSCMITDYPRFSWRGMHLDVSRHFFDVDFIKKYIDLLAMYKMNVFHWHLTDDQGWRIEIKKYPKLTEIGAYRNGSMIGHYNEQKFDTIRYGGFYTQEEIKEVVAYAKTKHITIVPEIEMPGHAMAALSTYPQYSCTGGPFEVGKAWGVYEDVFCAGNDSTFIFLQNILDEVAELFPGEYIHIGGDECPKIRWEKCEKCQDRMKNENLKDEHQLQSYFIQRIEKYLNAKGKKIIGWDEILEGGLVPNAAVMSWRGTDGGMAAAKQKHFVVMTPGSHCYFDHYQGNPRFEPLAIGGNTTLEKVYSYEPIPEELTEEESKYILGAQGNVWTEYMYNEKQVEYMVLPRMLALSEVLWSKKELKNEKLFKERIKIHRQTLLSYNYFLDQFSKIEYEIKPFKNCVLFITKSDTSYYSGIKSQTINPFQNISMNKNFRPESESSIKYNYSDTIKICQKNNLRLTPYDKKTLENYSKYYDLTFHISKSTSKKITYSIPPSKYYNTDADFTLVNGIKGFYPKINSEWLAWQGEDVEMIIDLGKKQKISKIEVGSLLERTSWIHPPSSMTIEISNDGKEFTHLVTNKFSVAYFEPKLSLNSDFNSKKTRFIKIILKNPGTISEGQPGAGNPSWMFFDEITID